MTAGERLVVDVDQLAARPWRCTADSATTAGDLLALEAHLVRREHGLGVAGERRHPGEVVLRHQLAGDDGDDALDSAAARDVSIERDARVRERAPQELEVEHPGERDVVDVVALAADEARVLLALDGVADAPDLLVWSAI